MTCKGRSDTVRDDSWYIRDWRARWGCKDSSGKEQEKSQAQGQYLFLLKKKKKKLASAVTLCQYQLCEWFGSVLLLQYPFHLEIHHESCGHEGTGQTLQTSQYWVSFLQPMWYGLELNKTPFRLVWPYSLLKILFVFLFFLLAFWDLRVACYTMLHI